MRENKGITLVALVVTIIVLVILAGISINLLFGQYGIVTRAGQAKEEYTNAQIAEQEYLNYLDKKIADYNIELPESDKELPENTKENPQKAGTEVKMPSNWYNTTAAYVSTEDGEIVKKSVKIASVTAVATGNGETVPVPNGFYYVGGTISTGVVISDNKLDKNKYANYTKTGEVTEGIPSGAIYKEDGSAKRIVYDERGNVTLDEFTAEEKNTAILGNQFVWIPCTAGEYVKKDWGKGSTYFDKLTNTAELIQIQKYGGFYIGRYEAGTSNITLSTGIDFAGENTADNWYNSKFSIRDGLNQTATGKITTKAGEIPYYHADYGTAFKLSKSMYQTEYVQSGLVTGTMWDAMLKFIADNDETVVTSSAWGNYSGNDSIRYTAGKGRYSTSNSSGNAAFTKSDGSYHYGIKTTAISEDVKKKNLYDVAGNLFEWTEELYHNSSSKEYIGRGGSFYRTYTNGSACYRLNASVTSTDTTIGFRPALYIK